MHRDLTEKSTSVFFLFCLWTFVLLCRPQDLFPVLAPLRPALVLSVLTVAVAIFQSKYLPGPLLSRERQIKYYLALYSVMVFGIPFSLYARLSFDRVLTEYIIIVVFVVVLYKTVHTIERLYKVLLVACLGNGLYAFYALRGFVPGSERLTFGAMFDPNDLAYFALVFLPFFLLFFSKKNKFIIRSLMIVFFSSGVLLILLSGSRGGLIAFGVSMVVFLLITTTIKRSAKFLVVSACVFFIAFAPLNIERYSTMLNLEEDYNVTLEGGRIDIWKIGLKAFIENPLTGVGVGSYSIAVGLDRQSRDSTMRVWQTAHNSVVQIGTETGVFGLVLYLMLCFYAVGIFLKVRKYSQDIQLVKIAEMSLVGFAGMFTAGLFLSQAYSTYWAFYVAISAVMSQLLLKANITLKENN
ncbi:O-antigen ligase family protein [Pelovirga terrestris]|uniref:O-antigen ligase family protein n=1 Tax=Pelovirga terrestris TaxID=2771352 RepID=A0A8J6QVX7_9BACT|nr:O-antigen ligase family protein [Pelovirga terrestris]MBD1399351.1 O-antigen ligase family protein [Pelovirga terrestris]